MSLQASVTAGAFTRAHVYYTRATWCLLVCEWVGIRWITRQFGTVCMVWHDMVWYDMVWYGTAGARCSHVGVAWPWHDMTWYGTARHGIVWSGLVEVCEGLDRTNRHSLLVRCATQSLLVFGSGCTFVGRRHQCTYGGWLKNGKVAGGWRAPSDGGADGDGDSWPRFCMHLRTKVAGHGKRVLHAVASTAAHSMAWCRMAMHGLRLRQLAPRQGRGL